MTETHEEFLDRIRKNLENDVADLANLQATALISVGENGAVNTIVHREGSGGTTGDLVAGIIALIHTYIDAVEEKEGKYAAARTQDHFLENIANREKWLESAEYEDTEGV